MLFARRRPDEPTAPPTNTLEHYANVVDTILTKIGVAPAAAIFYKTHYSGISYYLTLGLAGLILAAGLLAFAHQQKHYRYINHLYRILIIGGILGLVLFSVTTTLVGGRG